MQALNGTVVDRLAFELIKLRDLIWHESPLLSHFHDPAGNHYLMWWTDLDTKCNRWLLSPVSAADLSSYLVGELSLHHIITNTTGDVYFVDIDNNSVHRHIVKMRTTNIPPEYLPGENSFFDKRYASARH